MPFMEPCWFIRYYKNEMDLEAGNAEIRESIDPLEIPFILMQKQFGDIHSQN
jgi:hypothetical protein